MEGGSVGPAVFAVVVCVELWALLCLQEVCVEVWVLLRLQVCGGVGPVLFAGLCV